MKTIDEIVAAAAQLGPAEFLELRRHLDALDERLWQSERAAGTAELRQAIVSDDGLDQLVLRRRRECRR